MLMQTGLQSLELKAKLFSGLAEPSRLAILEALCERPLAVGELVSLTGLSQPNVSNHLNCLLACGLVQREQRGRYVYYSLSDARVASLLHLSNVLLAEVARGIYECVMDYQGGK